MPATHLPEGHRDDAPADTREGTGPGDDLAGTVGRKEARKQRARAAGRRPLGYGLGMFGMVGWSVAIPTVLGIALGVWLDTRTTTGYSWTLMLMIAGLVLGGVNAWYWVSKESEDDG